MKSTETFQCFLANNGAFKIFPFIVSLLYSSEVKCIDAVLDFRGPQCWTQGGDYISYLVHIKSKKTTIDSIQLFHI